MAPSVQTQPSLFLNRTCVTCKFYQAPAVYVQALCLRKGYPHRVSGYVRHRTCETERYPNSLAAEFFEPSEPPCGPAALNWQAK